MNEEDWKQPTVIVRQCPHCGLHWTDYGYEGGENDACEDCYLDFYLASLEENR